MQEAPKLRVQTTNQNVGQIQDGGVHTLSPDQRALVQRSRSLSDSSPRTIENFQCLVDVLTNSQNRFKINDKSYQLQFNLDDIDNHHNSSSMSGAPTASIANLLR